MARVRASGKLRHSHRPMIETPFGQTSDLRNRVEILPLQNGRQRGRHAPPQVHAPVRVGVHLLEDAFQQCSGPMHGTVVPGGLRALRPFGAPSSTRLAAAYIASWIPAAVSCESSDSEGQNNPNSGAIAGHRSGFKSSALAKSPSTSSQESLPRPQSGQRRVQMVPSLVPVKPFLESGPILDQALRVAQMTLGQGLVRRLRDRRRPVLRPVLPEGSQGIANALADLQAPEPVHVTIETSRQLIEENGHVVAGLRLQGGPHLPEPANEIVVLPLGPAQVGEPAELLHARDQSRRMPSGDRAARSATPDAPLAQAAHPPVPADPQAAPAG